jgi:hypothetical protein
VHEILFLEDMARYGLHLHLGTGTQIEKISLQPHARARFNPEYDETLAQELAKHEPDAVWVCKQGRWSEVRSRMAAQGYRAVALGTVYRDRVIFRVESKVATSH